MKNYESKEEVYGMVIECHSEEQLALVLTYFNQHCQQISLYFSYFLVLKNKFYFNQQFLEIILNSINLRINEKLTINILESVLNNYI